MAGDSAAMQQLVPALGALLLAAEVATGANLSCYQCFNATERELCVPAQCRPEDTVCFSLIVLIRTFQSKTLLLSKACAPKCTTSISSKYHWAIEHFTTTTVFRQCCSWSLCNRVSPAGRQAWAPHPLLLALGFGLRWPLL
ncbi:lymphocyte antigen 6L [Sorex fumeus]|uniref:lymphocyte antigen 6L n=1 Tax=Sorex fumeus TaxID=62283 RepID=UPI0024AD8CD9|nr:lymphocyte antigen 6L [Sorex fumeus]